MKKFEMIAKTSFGFEDILSEELQRLGATDIKKATRAVSFTGTLETMYLVNLKSRLSLRILKPIKSFPVPTEDDLYKGIQTIDWSEYMSPDDTLAVDAVTVKSNMSHSLYAALKTKDAIVDQFRDKTGRRPDVDLRFPKVKINVHISSDVASVALDSSGESLHKRGYRSQQGEAPLNETLAAGMIMLSGWDQQSPLTDIMCGSGTIVIEAAMMARNIVPGSLRNEFGFERWNDYDAELWKKILSDAKNEEKPELDFSLRGIDRSREAIKAATDNAKTAGVGKDIEFLCMPFEDYTPEEVAQTVITNPPYGGRITDDNLFTLYKEIGDNLKKKYSGVAWILTANKEAAGKIGLRATRRIPLFNGALECRYLKFEVYKGTRRVEPKTATDEV